MLRKLFVLSITLFLFLVVSQAAWAQPYTFHIGDPTHPGENGVRVGNDVYFESLDNLWNDISGYRYHIEQESFSFELRLYVDQNVVTDGAFAIDDWYISTKVVSVTSSDGNPRIITANGNDIFRMGTIGGERVSIVFDSGITLDGAGSATSGHAATSLWGGNYTAAGVTYQNGGPVVINYNNGGTGSPRGTNAGDVHTNVNLQGASFIGNTFNANSSGAVLSINNAASGINLTDTTFSNNTGWGARIYVNDGTYRATPNITVNLGATAAGTQSVFSGNSLGAITFGGQSGFANSFPTITAAISGAGDFVMNDKMEGEFGTYNMRINKTGSGTWYVGKDTINTFNALGNNNNNQGTIINLNGGRTVFESGSQFILQGTTRDEFNFNAGSTTVLGGSVIGGFTDSTYIKSGTINWARSSGGSQQTAPRFELDYRTGVLDAGKPIPLILETTSTATATSKNISPTNLTANGEIIVFNLLNVQGRIDNKVLVQLNGGGIITDPGVTGGLGPYFQPYIDGQDIRGTRWNASIYRAAANTQLVLNINPSNYVVTWTGGSGARWDYSPGLGSWRLEYDANVYDPRFQPTTFVSNDAAVFNDYNGVNAIAVRDNGICISRQGGFLSDLDAPYTQRTVVEPGWHVTGTVSRTFNGGYVYDEFDPNADLTNPNEADRRWHLGALLFDGTGVLTINNTGGANDFHGGTTISGGGVLNARYGNSLGNSQYAGEIALAGTNLAGFSVPQIQVQASGYGIEFLGGAGKGGIINFAYGDDPDAVTPTPSMTQRIHVADQTPAEMHLNPGQQMTITVTDYNWYAPDKRGGAVNVGTGTSFITTGQFMYDGNTSPLVGGAIWVDAMSNLATTGSSFLNNYAGQQGGAIYFTGGAGTQLVASSAAAPATFTNNSATLGGAIYVADTVSNFDVTGATFTDNEARTGGGGAIYALTNGLQLLATQTNFITNIAQGNGGAILLGNDVIVLLDDSTLSGNEAQNGGDGGAVYVGEHSQISAERSIFGDATNGGNIATGQGGAIYSVATSATTNNVLVITDAAFNLNEARGGAGGALYADFTAISATGADFIDNSSSTSGGAVYIANVDQLGTQMFDGGTFFGNEAKNGPGGAIFVATGGAALDVTGTKFGELQNALPHGNTASTYGGAIALTGGGDSLMANAASFNYNTAGIDGGAIYMPETAARPGRLDIDNGTFVSNTATAGSGGAIYATYTTIQGNISQFNGNTAHMNGGAIYVQNSDVVSQPLTLEHSSFLRNTATNGEGGAIYVANNNQLVDVIASSFSQNTANLYGGAIRLQNTSTLQANDTQFDTNSTLAANGEGGAIYAGDGSTITAVTTLPAGAPTTFFNNSSALKGGAIRIGMNGILTVDDATFDTNSLTGANGLGGAIFAGIGTTVNASTTSTSRTMTFDNNSTLGNGGAIYMDGNVASTTRSTLNSTGALYTDNTAGNQGGALHLNYTTTDIKGSIFASNIAVNEGGAIYYNDNPYDTTQKPFTADSAQFYLNSGSTGGAIYFVNQTMMNADAGAIFNGNIATSGDGGALAFATNGSTLNANNATFMDNVAAKNGGAVSLLDDGTVVISDDATFTGNKAGYGYDINGDLVVVGIGDGGAISLLKNGNVDVSSTTFSANIASGKGGAINMTDNAEINATTATFINNIAGGAGGAISVGDIATINATSATFTSNKAGYDDAGNIIGVGNGGAIAMNGTNGNRTQNTLDLTGALLNYNTATGNGGAVYANNVETISANQSTFNDNTAANGAAIYAVNNTTLTMQDASARNNVSAGKGGAVYYAKNNGEPSTITLGTANDSFSAYSEISGNTAGGIANSFYFDVTGGVTKVDVNVATVNGTLNVADPFAVDPDGNQIDLSFTKTGKGTWQLGGVNDLRNTAVGTTVDIKGGTFELSKAVGGTAGDGQLLLTNVDGTDHVIFDTGTKFVSSGNNRIETTTLDIATKTEMVLNGSLALNIGSDYTIGSKITGSGDLIKEDPYKLTFVGTTPSGEYSGNVYIHGGEFNIDKSGDMPGSGHFETSGSFNMDPYTTLSVIADVNTPAVTAKTMNINLVNLNITGLINDLSLDNFDQQIIILHTTEGINGEFYSVNVAGQGQNPPVDFLTYDLGFLNDHHDYGGFIGLRWYSKDTDLPAHGTFTLPDGMSFRVDVPLNDNTFNLDPNWDGKSLTKNGGGTLTLGGDNGYTGTTTINGGTLELTHQNGTGKGPEPVTVNKDGTLVLNFDGTYTKDVKGEGDVVKRGNGTVELTGTSDYTGGTTIEGGVLSISKKDNIGPGTVLFQGGTLRNTAEITDFDRELQGIPGKDIRLDTVADLTVLTPISDQSRIVKINGEDVVVDASNLVKVGSGTLTLTADNTYRGITYVQEGSLKLDGSVFGDVRVYSGAGIGGAGTVGGNLIISSGGAFDWYFGPTQSVSQPLNVKGDVTLLSGSIFRPITANQQFDFTEPMVGWPVMRYGGSLAGTFSEIDNRFSPFFDFELDYSVPGEIRIAGNLLNSPKTLSDSVATSLVIANRRMYRHAFNQMGREGTFCPTPMATGYPQSGPTLGQAPRDMGRSAWFTPTVRASKFASMFYEDNPYEFEGYGFQAGTTFWSNRKNMLGMTFGYERGSLRNFADNIRSHDYFFGFYHGYVFNDNYELRSFIGTGFQDFTSNRRDAMYNYTAKYKGGSFEANLELGRMFIGRDGYLLRPFMAIDFEYAHIESAQETERGYEFRNYGRSSLTQIFARFGAELQKRWAQLDVRGGATLRGLLCGPVRPGSSVFYPMRGAGSDQLGAKMGSSGVTLSTGFDWYFDQKRTAAFFLNYYADIFFDSDANAAMHTANIGLSYRF